MHILIFFLKSRFRCYSLVLFPAEINVSSCNRRIEPSLTKFTMDIIWRGMKVNWVHISLFCFICLLCYKTCVRFRVESSKIYHLEATKINRNTKCALMSWNARTINIRSMIRESDFPFCGIHFVIYYVTSVSAGDIRALLRNMS